MNTMIEGRVALVAGASQGIGKAIARAVHAEGANAYADKGVLLNVVSPTHTDTPVPRDVLTRQRAADRPEDDAAGAVSLASEGVSFITDSNPHIHGGSVTTL